MNTFGFHKIILLIFYCCFTLPAFAGSPFIIDSRTGMSYSIIKIGKQQWLDKNMQINIQPSWCYENKQANCEKYGRIYAHSSAMKACPLGTHLPSDDDFFDLESSLKGDSITIKSKEMNGTNSTGFNATAGGYREVDGTFHNIGFEETLWTSTESHGGSWAFKRWLLSSDNKINRVDHTKNLGYYVRCVLD